VRPVSVRWPLYELNDFEAVPGMGVRARVNGNEIVVATADIVSSAFVPVTGELERKADAAVCRARWRAGGVLPLPIRSALKCRSTCAVRSLVCVTSSYSRVTTSARCGVGREKSRAVSRQPAAEDKIRIVKEYQAQVTSFVMVAMA